MKTIKKLSYALLSVVLFMVSCGEPNDPPVPPKGLELTVSKSTIMSDGRDRATFTVMDGDKDVTSEAVIKNVATGEALDKIYFVSSTQGEYKFVATYAEKTSNEVTVNVSDAQLTVDPETIYSNGLGKATFTLTYNGNDVTAEATITNLTTVTEMAQGVREFVSPNYTGTFEFSAKYKNMKTNTVTVTVVEAPVAKLQLIADKSRVRPNGSEVVTFTVFNEGADITSSAKIKNLSTGGFLSDSTFRLETAGTVEFVAEYNGEISRPVSVSSGSFYKRVFVMKFTSINCGPCTTMAKSLAAANNTYPNRMVEAAIHSSLIGADPLIPSNYAEFAQYFSMTGLPTTFFDIKEYASIAISADAILQKVKPLQRAGAGAGASIFSKVEGTKVIVDVNVTASIAKEYYLGVMLLENGITGYNQAGADSKYVHNHTMRLSATPVLGDALGAMVENQQVTKHYEMDASKYKTGNCDVVCYVMYKEGDQYVVTNVVECPANGSVGYEFEK